MSKLQFGIEVEGGFAEGIDIRDTLRFLKEEYPDRDFQIGKKTDGTATFDADMYETGIEFYTIGIVPEEKIFEHIEDWKIFLETIDFQYHPKSCGTHIHFSPQNGEWGDFKYLKTLHNLFFSSIPFIRFFKFRQQQSYCLGDRIFSRLVRFYSEELQMAETKEELLESYENVRNSSVFSFSNRNVIRLKTGYDTIEFRLLPSEPDFLDIFVQIIINCWENPEKLSAGNLTESSIYDILKMHDMGDRIIDFKKYYEEWIKWI